MDGKEVVRLVRWGTMVSVRTRIGGFYIWVNGRKLPIYYTEEDAAISAAVTYFSSIVVDGWTPDRAQARLERVALSRYGQRVETNG